tara:strand:- start:1355 stop:2365 length:1011 start_codon:yes stop_codon:yes gene_type:complete
MKGSKGKSAINSESLECALKTPSLMAMECDRQEVHRQLQDFARSTLIEVDATSNQIELKGSDLTHHTADPWLKDNLNKLPFEVSGNDYADYHISFPKYDLCMEDSWSGYFVAKHLARKDKKNEAIVLIHLDDHTDMMSSLLLKTNNDLWDSKSLTRFDPANTDDWESAIDGGAIGIGSFVTALYYLKQPLHVLHLNHQKDNQQPLFINSSTVKHELLPVAEFASIEKSTQQTPTNLGSYKANTNARDLLKNVPTGRVIVHIDLDYFINDFNGNVGEMPKKSSNALRSEALGLLTDFFDNLTLADVKVERWIIATSPGFCSARHWQWLLEQLSTRID